MKTPDLADDAVTSPKVANGTLVGEDFAPGAIPAGAQGPPGPPGPPGPQGETGTVDTSNFYDKAASDNRFLGKNATAADSAALGRVAANDYAQAKGGHAFVSAEAPGAEFQVTKGVTDHWTITFACPDPTFLPGSLVFTNTSNDGINLFVDNGAGNPSHTFLAAQAATASMSTNQSGDAYEFDAQGWSDGMIAHIRVLTLNRTSNCHFQIWATWMTAT